MAEPASQPAVAESRHWFQFSLRRMYAVVALVSVGCAGVVRYSDNPLVCVLIVGAAIGAVLAALFKPWTEAVLWGCLGAVLAPFVVMIAIIIIEFLLMVYLWITGTRLDDLLPRPN